MNVRNIFALSPLCERPLTNLVLKLPNIGTRLDLLTPSDYKHLAINSGKHPELTSPEEDEMGECLIPCLEFEIVRDQSELIPPQKPPSDLKHCFDKDRGIPVEFVQAADIIDEFVSL